MKRFTRSHPLPSHLLTPTSRPSLSQNPNISFPGRHLYRININIEQFKKHISPHSLQDTTSLPYTTTHIMIKILVNIISITPALNGYLLFQKFYPSLKDSIDISVCHDLPAAPHPSSASASWSSKFLRMFPGNSSSYKLSSLTTNTKLLQIQTYQHDLKLENSKKIPLVTVYEYLCCLFEVYLKVSLSSLYQFTNGILPYGVAMVYLPTETINTSSVFYPFKIFSKKNNYYSVPIIISMNEIPLSTPTPPAPPVATPQAPSSPASPSLTRTRTQTGIGTGSRGGGSTTDLSPNKSVHWIDPCDTLTVNIWIDNLAMSADESAEFINQLQEYFHY
jgi:hypothetical protein